MSEPEYVQIADGQLQRAKVLNTPAGRFVAGTDPAPENWTEIQSEAEISEVDAGGFPALSRKQLLFALLELDITADMVGTTISSIPDAKARESARIDWAASIAYHRDHSLVSQMGAALSLSDDVIDEAWMNAAAIDSQ